MVAQTVSREIRLFPRQRRFVIDPARFPGYVGGIGSGKSYAGAVKAIARLGTKGLGMVTAPTYTMLRDATQRTLLGLMDELGIVYEFRKGENALLVPATGHEIIFRSLDDPEKARGPNLDWVWIDEASLVERLAWNIVIGRARVGPNPQVWATFTPKGRNWCWEVWERDANPNHPLYRVRTEENPELPYGFAESLGYTGSFAAQELGGEFVAFEGLAYAMFSRSKHVRTVECDGWRTILGVDIGTRNPTAILTVRGEPERRHIEREVYRSGMDSEDILAAIMAEADRTRAQRIFLDPSAASYIEALKKRGYPAEKAVNEVKFGIGEVSSALAGEDALTIDPSCVNLMAELESYHYPENKTESDVPVKQGDHAVDALRYAIASEANVAQPRIYLA